MNKRIVFFIVMMGLTNVGMATETTQQNFDEAVAYVNSLDNFPFYFTDTLTFYANYQQATVGPCKEHGVPEWEGIRRAQWLAWNELGDKSKEDAMKDYYRLFIELTGTNGIKRDLSSDN